MGTWTLGQAGNDCARVDERGNKGWVKVLGGSNGGARFIRKCILLARDVCN